MLHEPLLDHLLHRQSHALVDLVLAQVLPQRAEFVPPVLVHHLVIHHRSGQCGHQRAAEQEPDHHGQHENQALQAVRGHTVKGAQGDLASCPMEGDHVLVDMAGLQVRHATECHLAQRTDLGDQDGLLVHPASARVAWARQAHGEPHARQDVGDPHDATEQAGHVERQTVAVREVPLCEVLQDAHDAQHPHHADDPEHPPELRKPQHFDSPAAAVTRDIDKGQAHPIADNHSGIGHKPSRGVPDANASRVHL
mmetsp:Transcript_74659/g.228448  ORF Transcript_74659/g.228448 Transcript_74659/m.228448 type:complete len:252 (+) Transcript_74659:1635-2390(+)